MTISLYVSFRDVPEGLVDKFIADIKEFLAARYAGQDITVQINYY